MNHDIYSICHTDSEEVTMKTCWYCKHVKEGNCPRCSNDSTSWPRMSRGSIELARKLCCEIAGPPDEDDNMAGIGYGSVDVAEILSSEVVNLREAISNVLDDNRHLADGETCTLLGLKIALRESGSPWVGDIGRVHRRDL